MSEIKLSYFDFPGGRGEDCRLALHIGGADWTDDRVTDWSERKGKTPFGGLPVMAVDGQEIAQSNAILAYVGRRFGLHPSDAIQAARHEAILNAVEDLRSKVGPTLSLKDEDEKKTVREALADGYIPTWAGNIEKQLGDGPFFAGDQIGVADLKLFVAMRWFVNGVVDHIPTDVFSAYPKMLANYEAVNGHPKVVGWYA
jgi:glutathione S-transferase